MDIASTLQSLDQTVGTLSEKSTRLEAYFKDQREMLASTPSIWPVRGYLSERFGNRTTPSRASGTSTPASTSRSPAAARSLAPADGVVVFCGTKNGYGNIIVLDHGYGTVTRYGHLDGVQRAARPAREAG